MNTVLEFDMDNVIILPPEFQNDDVRYSDSFVEYFIEYFSKSGDMVFSVF